MLDQMSRLIELFAPITSDRSTLDELHRMVNNQGSWPKARGLFDRIRQKSLKVHESNAALHAQYGFEEACAKLLYNWKHLPSPYDADAPFWIVPSALDTARCLGIDEASVLAIVKSKREAWALKTA